MSNRPHTAIPLLGFLLAAALIFSLTSWAMAQTPEEQEKQAIAKIEEALGSVNKDADGKVIDIYVLANWDVSLASIDFSVFSHVESLTIHSVKSKKNKRASLASLARMPSELRRLSIIGTDIEDGQLSAVLQKQRSLMWLTLSGTTTSDGSMAEIGKLETLQILYLDGTKITDEGLKSLGGLSYLFGLNLANTAISDVGLAEIKKLSLLGTLDLRGTNVTDAGILQLAEIPLLQTVNVSKTKVTEEGQKALQKLLPRLKVTK